MLDIPKIQQPLWKHPRWCPAKRFSLDETETFFLFARVTNHFRLVKNVDFQDTLCREVFMIVLKYTDY